VPAHHYRRIIVQELRRRRSEEAILATPSGRGFGIRDGKGIVFISHAGKVFPSGSCARAYAAGGDPMASDPLCLYQPRARE
jgi:MoaA/NifB/PqqE/SkfB family radical SAM enzyme